MHSCYLRILKFTYSIFFFYILLYTIEKDLKRLNRYIIYLRINLDSNKILERKAILTFAII